MRGRVGTFQITGPVIFVAVLFLSAPNVNGQVSQAQEEDLHRVPVVVVLHSYHHGYTWTDNISDGIRTAFAASDEPVDLRFEFLDSRRIATEAYFEDLRRLLQTKYADIDIDVVVCADDQAMYFLLGTGAEVFEGVPVVVCSVSSFDPAMRDLRAITGLEDSIDIEATLEVAIDLHPKTRDVVVITDTTRTGSALRSKAEEIFESHPHGVRFRYLEDLTLEELVGETAAIDENSMVFFFLFSRDREGRVFSLDESLRRIRQVCKVPIYAVWESCLGHGIVGGKITSGREEGRMVAELVQRIVGGERASDIPMSSSPTQFMFDWSELDRFGVDEDELPAGSVVVGRPESFVGEHQGMFLTIAAAFTMLVLLVVGLVANTFRRRRAEAMQARFAAILGTTTDFVAMATFAGEITYLNPAGRRLVGWDEQEPIEGKHVRDIHPKSVRRLIGKTAVPVALKDGVWAGETFVTHRDGYEIPVSQVILANRSSRGEIEFMSTIIRDLRPRIETEETLRAIEEHLQHSRKMEAIGQLAGGVAHDFNNLLTGIMGNADLLSMLLPDGSREAKRARDILIASEKAAKVTRQLLMFSRKGSLKTTVVDLQTIVESVISLLSRSIDRRIEIERRFTDDRTTVMGDSSQIENAILNLAVNARDAMPDGGILMFSVGAVTLDEDSIAVRSEELAAGDYVEVVVSDTGVGIPARLQTKIFEPFFTTKGPGKGTGLGLATAYGCVRNHRGRISVESEAGQGSSFVILLPMTKAEVDRDAAVVEDNVLPGAEGRILVVDDEKIVRDIVIESLESLGYVVIACEDGHEAVEVYRREGGEIDMVILDLIMPKMNGSDTFGALKAINPDVRVMLSSGYSANQEVEDLLENGAHGFLVKPFTLSELAEEVYRIINLQLQ